MKKDIKVFEIRLKVFLFEDIPLNLVQNHIAHYIDSTLAQNEKLKDFHEENKYKMYTFNMFWPIEKEKIYSKEKIYTVMIRTVDPELARYFSKKLCNHYTSYMKGLTVENRIIPKKMISDLYSLTPVVIKRKGEGYWRNGMGLEDYERRLFENAVKKYNQYIGDKMNEDFQLYTNISFLNRKPASVECKTVKLLGDKINFKIANNPQAQELAYFLSGTGIGENNARGAGFCNYRWM